MICVSIQGKDLNGIRQALAGGLEMAEIRLDRCPLSLEDIETLFAKTDIPLVATCRIAESGGEAQTEQRLEAAIKAGAKYVDLEVEASAALADKIGALAEECGTDYIRSFHDFQGTPSADELKDIVERCFDGGADVAKIVTTAAGKADCSRVMALYENAAPGSLLAFCMGEAGRSTRLDCLAKGAPYTYCALTEEEAAAPGQWAYADMVKAVYGDRTFPGAPAPICPGKPASAGPDEIGNTARNPIVIPCSKSYAQRGILAAALADGMSHLEGYSPCGDNESAIAMVESLGASVERDGSRLTIKGIAAKPGCLKVDSVHVGESGFLTRMTIPLMAALNLQKTEVTGEKTLVGRPLKGAAEALAAFGSELRNAAPSPQASAPEPIWPEKPASAGPDGSGTPIQPEKPASAGPDEPGTPARALTVPLTIESPIRPAEAKISGHDGSQIISGLMAALPLLGEDSIIHVKDPRSVPYLLVTLDVLNRFGIEVDSITGDGNIDFIVRGRQRYHASDFHIEGDWSSAANFLVAGAIYGSADIEGLEMASLQADSSILEILADAGAIIYQVEEGHAKGTVHVQKAPLTAFDADANDCPDIFPIVAVLAALCEGTTAIHGTGRLAGKESDRAAAILAMLQQMGVAAAIENDTMYIEGHSLSSRLVAGNLLKGGSYTSNHDHRMVMALKVASLAADSPIVIDDTDCVAKSFPTFLQLFEKYTK
jgi:3-phosphoshikimate 1-carboxyvinyltransferase